MNGNSADVGSFDSAVGRGKRVTSENEPLKQSREQVLSNYEERKVVVISYY